MPGCKKRRRDGLNGVSVVCFFYTLWDGLVFVIELLSSFPHFFFILYVAYTDWCLGVLCLLAAAVFIPRRPSSCSYISLYIYTYFLFDDQRSTSFFNAYHSNRNPQFLVCTEGMVVQVGPYFVAYLRLKWGYSQEQGFGSKTTNE